MVTQTCSGAQQEDQMNFQCSCLPQVKSDQIVDYGKVDQTDRKPLLIGIFVSAGAVFEAYVPCMLLAPVVAVLKDGAIFYVLYFLITRTISLLAIDSGFGDQLSFADGEGKGRTSTNGL